MNPLSFEQFDPIKIPLIQRFYKQHYPSGKAKKDEQIIIAKEHHQLCAVVRLRNLPPYRLLTGMVVDSAKRNQGIGHQLLNFCEEKILDEQVYCFAFSHLEAFYRAHQFFAQKTEALPPVIHSLYLRYSRQGKSIIPMKYSPELKNKNDGDNSTKADEAPEF